MTDRPFKQIKLELPPMLIRASAGSGKTFRLSTRLIKLLIAGEEVEKILATTFTRGAAAEILHRVLRRLSFAAMSESAAAELGRQIEITGLSMLQVQQCLERLAAKINRVNIRTLDSWFFQISRLFPLELGVDPAPAVLDEDERERLLSRSIGRMLIAKNPDRRQEAIRQFNRGTFSSRIVGKLAKNISGTKQSLRRQGPETWNWLNVDQSARNRLLDETRAAFSELSAPSTGRGQPNKLWHKGLEDIRRHLEQGLVVRLVENGIAQKFVEGARDYAKVPFPAESIPAFEALCALIALELETELLHENISAGELLNEVYKEFDQLLSGEKKIGFEEIKLQILNSALGENADDLYYRLDCRISHLLLDEFQDTSIFEWRILQPLIQELLSKSGQEVSFFCVGDVKQAIYGWRGGCAELFNVVEETYREHLQIEPSDESRRSSYSVIETVNSVFKGLADNPAVADYRSAAAKWSRDFNRHTTTRSNVPGRVEFYLVGSEADDGSRDQVLTAACDKIAELYANDPSRSIGVLVRRNTTVLKILYILSSDRYPSIPASEEGGNPLTDSMPVSVILSLITMIDHPADLISRFHVADSPLGALIGFSDHRDEAAAYKLISGIRRRAFSTGLGPLISDLVGKLTEAGAAAGRDLQRLARLVELGYQLDRRGISRIGDFIAYTKRRKIADSSSVPVRIMTIHGSKGLEFDSVVLPDLDSAMIAISRDSYLVDSPIGDKSPTRASRYTKKANHPFSPRLSQFFKAREDEALSSELCNLYVAMTRAKDQLFMFGRNRKEYKRPTCSGILFHALATPPPSSESESGSVRLIYSAGDKDRPHGVGETEQTSLEISPVAAPRLDQPIPRRPGPLEHQTPSNRLAAGRRPGSSEAVRRILEPLNIAALSFGTMVHRAFEEIEWSESGPPSAEEVMGLLVAGGAPRDEAAKAAAAVTRAMSNNRILCLFEKSNYLGDNADRVDVYRELPFSFLSGRSIVSGTIDRLTVSYSGDRPVSAQVVDFKTDSVSGSAAGLDQVRQRYQAQVADYLEAAGRLTGLTAEKISGRLVLTSCAEIVVV